MYMYHNKFIYYESPYYIEAHLHALLKMLMLLQIFIVAGALLQYRKLGEFILSGKYHYSRNIIFGCEALSLYSLRRFY